MQWGGEGVCTAAGTRGTRKQVTSAAHTTRQGLIGRSRSSRATCSHARQRQRRNLTRALPRFQKQNALRSRRQVAALRNR